MFLWLSVSGFAAKKKTRLSLKALDSYKYNLLFGIRFLIALIRSYLLITDLIWLQSFVCHLSCVNSVTKIGSYILSWTVNFAWGEVAWVKIYSYEKDSVRVSHDWRNFKTIGYFINSLSLEHNLFPSPYCCYTDVKLILPEQPKVSTVYGIKGGYFVDLLLALEPTTKKVGNMSIYIYIYILLDVLVCSIAEYFYELCMRSFDLPYGLVKIQTTRNILTVLARHLYSTLCSWIIKCNTLFWWYK